MPTIRPWDAAPLRRAFAGLDPAGLAQEWLRHNLTYRRDYTAMMRMGKADADVWRAFARRWGLRFPC
ncbi:transcriptional regulator domain-containing protein [Gluconacetobacter sacchari]|uniref:transcriptional regulator domain-containing protein n=1 Tax=Gluconacetobacter sacchari TaxID=92759 RepID=UPI0039B43970